MAEVWCCKKGADPPNIPATEGSWDAGGGTGCSAGGGKLTAPAMLGPLVYILFVTPPLKLRTSSWPAVKAGLGVGFSLGIKTGPSLSPLDGAAATRGSGAPIRVA